MNFFGNGLYVEVKFEHSDCPMLRLNVVLHIAVEVPDNGDLTKTKLNINSREKKYINNIDSNFFNTSTNF